MVAKTIYQSVLGSPANSRRWGEVAQREVAEHFNTYLSAGGLRRCCNTQTYTHAHIRTILRPSPIPLPFQVEGLAVPFHFDPNPNLTNPV